MPILLALECSTDACSVGLSIHGSHYQVYRECAREHHRILLPAVVELLHHHQLELGAVDAIVYGSGPGSFTGLRLCAGVVQGLAYAAGKPVIPVSSLAAVAQTTATRQTISQELLVAMDARMGDVYVGVYRCVDGVVEALLPDTLQPLEHLDRLRMEYPRGLAIGELWPGGGQIVFPEAGAVLTLADSAWRAGRTLPPTEALPVYLREEISWKKWQPQGRPE